MMYIGRDGEIVPCTDAPMRLRGIPSSVPQTACADMPIDGLICLPVESRADLSPCARLQSRGIPTGFFVHVRFPVVLRRMVRRGIMAQ